MLTVWGLEGAEAGPEVLGPRENLRFVNPATMTYLPHNPLPPCGTGPSLLLLWVMKVAQVGQSGVNTGCPPGSGPEEWVLPYKT